MIVMNIDIIFLSAYWEAVQQCFRFFFSVFLSAFYENEGSIVMNICALYRFVLP